MKKNLIWIAAFAIIFASCEKLDFSNDEEKTEKRDVTFLLEGNFKTPTMTRAVLTTTDGTTMSDLWVMDYVDGALVQIVHQVAADEDFGTPTLSLSIGEHELYFVCTAGGEPTVAEAMHKITWAIPRDTFWKKLTKTISSNTAATQTVALERVTTRLTVKIEDAIPAGTTKIEIQPTTWYYGLDWLTGNGTDAKSQPFTINIPSNYAGRTNTKLAVYGMAQATEFNTDVSITAKDGTDNILATETITDAPMKKNRSTDYSGTLFVAGTSMTIGLNDVWDTSVTGNW